MRKGVVDEKKEIRRRYNKGEMFHKEKKTRKRGSSLIHAARVALKNRRSRDAA